MKMRKCGRSEIEVSTLGIGCWSFGGGEDDYWGYQDQKQVEAVVRSALDHGINFFDTAEAYNDGRSEQSLGQALKGRRDQAVVATKVSPANTEPRTLREHCEASLRRLDTDHIDVYYVHWPIADQSVEDAFGTLIDLKSEGKIRSISVSNHGVMQLREALATGAQIDLNQITYNLLSRAIEVVILPLCIEENIGVVSYMPLMQGLLTGKYKTVDDVPPLRRRTRHFRSRGEARHGQPGAEAETFAAVDRVGRLSAEMGIPMTHLSLAWVMAKPGITSVLVGARNRTQIEENAAAAEVNMTAQLIQRLDDAGQAVLEALGADADYWESSEDSRIR